MTGFIDSIVVGDTWTSGDDAVQEITINYRFIGNLLKNEGFSSKTDSIVASVCAYREGRHGSERWVNYARFSDATDLFRFRVIPDIPVTTAMVIICRDERFEITSVEDVKGRGMYIEVLAKKVTASG